jgi:outer membrane lipoprotein-sorting protein
MATFDKVKEDRWDIYVDAETGIFLGRVIVPLNDKENGESTFIDKLYIDKQIDQSRFDYQIPKGYQVTACF